MWILSVNLWGVLMRNPQPRHAYGYSGGPYCHGCREIFSNVLFLEWPGEVGLSHRGNWGRAGAPVFLGKDLNLPLLLSPLLVPISEALCRGFHSTGEAASAAPCSLYLPLPSWPLPNLSLSTLQFPVEAKPTEVLPSYVSFEMLNSCSLKKPCLFCAKIVYADGIKKGARVTQVMQSVSALLSCDCFPLQSECSSNASGVYVT